MRSMSGSPKPRKSVEYQSSNKDTHLIAAELRPREVNVEDLFVLQGGAL